MEAGIPDTLRRKIMLTGSVDEKCKKHPDTNLFKIPGGRLICEICSEEERVNAVDVEKEEKRKSAAMYAHNYLRLPARLKLCSFDNYEETEETSENKRKCKEYVDNWPQGGGVIMLGGVGTGKTHLAVSICKELCDKGVICGISTVTKIIRKVRSSWKNKIIETEQEIINSFLRPGLLIIDEVGSQYGTDSERITINEIVNDRYERLLPTILIGNVKMSELSEIMGARVVDRVCHEGIKLVFNWNSYRI